MTDQRPSGPGRPFGPDELDGVSGSASDDMLAATRLARTLEDVAARGSVRPSADFTDRVMAAVAQEPAAAPVRAAGTALRRGAVGAFLAALRDAWRVTVNPAFPMVVRAQAIALVLLVAGLATGGGLATAGALGLLDGDPPSPSPAIVVPSPSIEATPAPTLAPTESLEPTPSMDDESAEPSGSPEPSESPDEESAEPTDDGSTSSGSTGTPAPTRRPSPTRTPSPSATPSDDSGHSDEPETPRPSRTPDPSPTPHD